MVTGSVLVAVHAELTEMVRELNQNQLTLTALDRICVTRPELRAELVAEMQRVIAEQQAAASAPAKKSKRR